MFKRLHSISLSSLILLLTLVAFAHAAAAVHSFQQVAISPDGTRVAWVASAENPNGEPIGGSIVIWVS